MLSDQFPHGAVIPWSRGEVLDHWHQVSIWAMQTLGLPGDRYITDFNIVEMTWWFRTPEDRLIFVLSHGARCATLSEYA